MHIHFIGLSSFLIENKAGYRILIDPFTDSTEWGFGPVFPTTFKDKPFGANIVLHSEPDLDHSSARPGLLDNAPATKPNSNPFPHLNLKGTLVYEWNGDVNIAWSYTVDDIRLAHFADNAHVLTNEQVQELGQVDIVFMPPQKKDSEALDALEVTKKNIALLQPKLIVWGHHIAPEGLPADLSSKSLRPFFQNYFAQKASNHTYYKDSSSFMELCYVLENASLLNQQYQGMVVDTPTIEVTEELLAKGQKEPVTLLFVNQLAK